MVFGGVYRNYEKIMQSNTDVSDDVKISSQLLTCKKIEICSGRMMIQMNFCFLLKSAIFLMNKRSIQQLLNFS